MIELFKTALMITGFVLAMMLIIEYLNVLTAGEWQKRLAGHVWGQYALAAFLGILPVAWAPSLPLPCIPTAFSRSERW